MLERSTILASLREGKQMRTGPETTPEFGLEALFGLQCTVGVEVESKQWSH